MTIKLFISYRSTDSAKVDTIVSNLASLKNEDGTSRYSTWQDKKNMPIAQDWWESIVDAIIDCDVFVFFISQEALKSEVCKAELAYARKRNRPIIPVVLTGEFFLNETTGKYDITYWTAIPTQLNDMRAQFLFYTGVVFFSEFQNTLDIFQRKPQRDINAPRPLNPDANGKSQTNHALYDEACDYAGRLVFAEAEKHFHRLIQRNDPDYGPVAYEWIELLRLYAELIEVDQRPNARFIFKKKWDTYTALFPKDFWDGVFDPKDFAVREGLKSTVFISPAPPSPLSGSKIQIDPPPVRRAVPRPLSDYDNIQFGPPIPKPLDIDPVVPMPKSKQSISMDQIPFLFSWINIPKGKVTLKEKGFLIRNQHFDVPDFTISKYPITNAQYGCFIDAGGYKDKHWWTEGGWTTRRKGTWTEPLYWQNKGLNGSEQPVVGVSWYEGIAFCLWLSETLGKTIMLPTEQQWQRAAQGDKGLIYPWGNEWDNRRCNNGQIGATKTTPVNQYEDKGGSPYGVIDMIGNVWEWCVTGRESQNRDIESYETRALRGNEWQDDHKDFFRADFRNWVRPEERSSGYGFRISRSI